MPLWVAFPRGFVQTFLLKALGGEDVYCEMRKQLIGDDSFVSLYENEIDIPLRSTETVTKYIEH